MTGYRPDGGLVEIGPASMKRITKLCFFLDKLDSKIAVAHNAHKGKKEVRLRKAAMRMRTRIRNLVDDVHKKTASFLARSFDVVLLPTFNASSMVKRARRRINSKTARAMLTWAHYRFRQTLLARVRSTGTHVELVTEEYTSKTCGKCGQLHDKLGSSKVFRCPSLGCAHVVDRDANAARNILLKNSDAIHLAIVNPSRRPPGEGVALPPGATH